MLAWGAAGVAVVCRHHPLFFFVVVVVVVVGVDVTILYRGRTETAGADTGVTVSPLLPRHKRHVDACAPFVSSRLE